MQWLRRQDCAIVSTLIRLPYLLHTAVTNFQPFTGLTSPLGSKLSWACTTTPLRSLSTMLPKVSSSHATHSASNMFRLSSGFPCVSCVSSHCWVLPCLNQLCMQALWSLVVGIQQSAFGITVPTSVSGSMHSQTRYATWTRELLDKGCYACLRHLLRAAT